MIYFRERANDKKSKVQNSKKNIFEEIKSKVSKAAQQKKNTSPLKQQRKDVQNSDIPKEANYQPYRIAKKQQELNFKSNQHSLNDQRLCQSIVVDQIKKSAFSRKKRSLSIEKNFDIQISNSMGSRVTLQTFVKLLQNQNQTLKQGMQKMKMELQKLKGNHSKSANQSKIIEQLEYTLLQQKVKNTQNDLTLTKYQKYFNQCKALLLNVAMELIQAKNTLGLSISTQRLIEKQHQLARCLQKMEKMISIYSLFLQDSPKQHQKENLAFDQLNIIVKYQQKTIEKLTESKNANNGCQYQNSLLRYQINRLSKQNQGLISELASLKHHQKKHNGLKTAQRRQNTNDKVNRESFCQTEEQEKNQTPIVKLQDFRDSIKTPFEVEPKETKNFIESRMNELQIQLQQKLKIIKNLQIEKDYISDQLMSVEKDKQQLNFYLNQTRQQKEKYVQELKQQLIRLQSENTISRQQFFAHEETISLLKDKIRQLQDRRQSLKDSSKYVELHSGSQNVTIQTLLKFLKRKDLAKYHEALMELITKYQTRIVELNTCFIQEKTVKEQLYSYCKGLISLVNSQSNLTLGKLVSQINKYYEKVEQVTENEIDQLLRKVKSFSIGIAQNELSNIRSELQEYIVQLQTRLPALSEAYLQDGSSVADSHNVSIQNFQP